jgi:hypothetical protein
MEELIDSKEEPIIILDTSSKSEFDHGPLKILFDEVQETRPWPVQLTDPKMYRAMEKLFYAQFTERGKKQPILIPVHFDEKYVTYRKFYIDPRKGEVKKDGEELEEDKKWPWPKAVVTQICIDHSLHKDDHAIFITGVEFGACVRTYAKMFRELGFDVVVDLKYTDYKNSNRDQQAIKDFKKYKIEM